MPEFPPGPAELLSTGGEDQTMRALSLVSQNLIALLFLLSGLIKVFQTEIPGLSYNCRQHASLALKG